MPGLPNSRPVTTSSHPERTSDASPDLVGAGAGQCPAFVSFSGDEEPCGSPTWVRAIREGVSILAAHPQVGRVVEDMEEAFRDWPIQFGDSGYVVRYRFDGDQVTILTVRHQREAGF